MYTASTLKDVVADFKAANDGLSDGFAVKLGGKNFGGYIEKAYQNSLKDKDHFSHQNYFFFGRNCKHQTKVLIENALDIFLGEL